MVSELGKKCLGHRQKLFRAAIKVVLGHGQNIHKASIAYAATVNVREK